MALVTCLAELNEPICWSVSINIRINRTSALKNKSITVLLGDDASQMTNKLSVDFAFGFEALGFSTRAIRASSIGSFDALEMEIRNNNTGLFVSLSGQGMHMDSENNVYQKFKIPFFLMLLDPPLHHWDKIDIPVGLDAISTLSDADKKFIDTYSEHKRNVFQLAHAAAPRLPQPWAEKDIELFYCATLRASPTVQRTGWLKYGELVEKRLNAILEEHLSSQGISLINAIKYVLSEEVDCTQAMVLHPYYVTLDLYLRDYHRVETLKSINSVPLILAGGGWRTILREFPGTNVRYLGRIHPNEVEGFYARAKVVLNTINTYHGSHERVFSAMANGSVALTSYSDFYKSAFGIDEIVLFTSGENSVNENCRRLFSNDSHLKKIATNGHQKFLEKHTWSHRAETALNQLSLFT